MPAGRHGDAAGWTLSAAYLCGSAVWDGSRGLTLRDVTNVAAPPTASWRIFGENELVRPEQRLRHLDVDPVSLKCLLCVYVTLENPTSSCRCAEEDAVMKSYRRSSERRPSRFQEVAVYLLCQVQTV